MLKGINEHNFCKYLALVNFIAYNYGFHVHEKAILMVYIPLLISVLKNSSFVEVQRVSLLGVVMVWSFAPLLPDRFEGVIKNLAIVG